VIRLSILLQYLMLRKAVVSTSLFFYGEMVVFLHCCVWLLMVYLFGCNQYKFWRHPV